MMGGEMEVKVFSAHLISQILGGDSKESITRRSILLVYFNILKWNLCFMYVV